MTISKDSDFPKQVFIVIDNPGTEDEFLSANKSVETVRPEMDTDDNPLPTRKIAFYELKDIKIISFKRILT